MTVTFSNGKLDGKVAFVTGGSRGIGAAIARRLANEGAAVAITYFSSKEDAESVIADLGTRGLAIRADSADAHAVKAAVATTARRFGRLDILVNNAAMFRIGLIDDFSLEHIDQMLAINVKSLFAAIQESLRFMEKGGRIINIGSVSSDYMPIPGVSVYAATKGAVASMTRALARDLGSRDITINNVQPGRIDTAMNPADGPMADRIRSSIALGRYGSGDDVAGLVAWLASPEAAFITGTNLKVDGGTSA
ncbi:3-oxoacyl-ACP reductase family protein [Caballeronia sp. dw_276]|uniref:3-oxoacyl-ACP reductase family protein n=1 Tax=Caballeronia sp. dw_276 TaxID=2719795 RepID=UPI001BD2A0AB|nr:3-oxoacyl-ACP reductase family protein [Caballeronia sp. dw_276]